MASIDHLFISPATDAVAQTSSSMKGWVAAGDETICIHADGLAGSETVTIYMRSQNTLVPVYDRGTSAQAVLTATEPALVFPGGLEYAVAKSATVAACGVYGNVIAPTAR
jgi:hypothetical protein